MLGVVVPKRMRRRTCSARALPKRGMRQAVKVDRRLFVGNGLQQADVGRIARLADKTVFLANPCGQRRFKRPARMGIKQEHTRLDHAFIAVLQAGNLCPDDVRMSGNAKVVIAIQTDRFRSGIAAMQYGFSTPLAVPVGHEFLLEAFFQAWQQRRVAGSGSVGTGGAIKYLHKSVPLLKTDLLKTFSQKITFKPC